MNNSNFADSVLQVIQSLFPDKPDNKSNSSTSDDFDQKSDLNTSDDFGQKSDLDTSDDFGQKSNFPNKSNSKSNNKSNSSASDDFGRKSNNTSQQSNDGGWGDALKKPDKRIFAKTLGKSLGDEGKLDDTQTSDDDFTAQDVLNAIAQAQAMSELDQSNERKHDGHFWGARGNYQQQIHDRFVKPAVNWRQYLKRCITQVETERSWSRLNRRSHSLGYPMASEQKKDTIANIIFCIDVSGSMWTIVRKVVNEIVGLGKLFNIAQSRIIYYDNMIQADESIKDFKKLPPMSNIFYVRGGGGNDLGCVDKHIREKGYKPQMVFYFTDGGDEGTPIFNNCKHTYVFITKDGVTDYIQKTINQQSGNKNITIVKTTLAGR